MWLASKSFRFFEGDGRMQGGGEIFTPFYSKVLPFFPNEFLGKFGVNLMWILFIEKKVFEGLLDRLHPVKKNLREITFSRGKTSFNFHNCHYRLFILKKTCVCRFSHFKPPFQNLLDWHQLFNKKNWQNQHLKVWQMQEHYSAKKKNHGKIDEQTL